MITTTQHTFVRHPSASGSNPGLGPGDANTAAYWFLALAVTGVIMLLPTSLLSFVGSIAMVLAVSWVCGRSILSASSGVALALTGWLYHADLSGLPPLFMIVGLLGTILSFVPIATWRRRPERFPILGAFLAIQGIFIYVGTFLSQPSIAFQPTYPVHVREIGLVATSAYVLVLVLSEWWVRRTSILLPRIRNWTSRSATVADPARAFRRAALLVLIGIVSNDFLPTSVSGHLGYIPTFIGLARIAGVALMLVLWLRGQLSTPAKIITVLAILADAVAGANGAFALYATAGCAITAFMVVLTFRARVAIWLMMAVVPLAILLNVAKTDARAANPNHLGHLAAVSALLHYSEQNIVHPERTTFTTSADRFGYVDELLGYVVVHVPSTYPYWNKDTYLYLPFVFLPRVIAPFKPDQTLANQFGRKYGLLAPNDFVTSEDTPIQVEAWANFGAPGLIGIGLVVGLFLAIIGGWIDPNRIDGIAIGSLVAFQASTGIESGISTLSLIPFIILFYAPILWWVVYSTPGDPSVA